MLQAGEMPDAAVARGRAGESSASLRPVHLRGEGARQPLGLLAALPSPAGLGLGPGLCISSTLPGGAAVAALWATL